MSIRAWAYIWAVLVAGLVIVVQSFGTLTISTYEIVTFCALTSLATGSQLFEAEHGKQSFYPHFVFFIAALLTLQPALFILVITIPHLIEWGKERFTKGQHLKAWYIQPFNITVHITAGFAARWTFHAIDTNPAISASLAPVLAATATVLVYVFINHLLVGCALVLARGISWKKSGILEIESLLPDVILSFLGYIVAVLWEINPLLTLPAISPLVLMYRALMIPQLKQEAQTDGKTGLWNARHFTKLFTAEMERAKRFNRPVAVIMADLDLLRNINNTYGHLAGDVVLTGIGRIIRESVREYDIAGRFGGEEFAIVLPETTPDEARVLAERLRSAVQAATFEVTTSPTPISCTMSMGVSCCPWDADEITDLVHEADVAVYQAKLRGRNCVVFACDVPHSAKLEHMPNTERVTVPYNVPFVPRAIPLQTVMANSQAEAVLQAKIAAEEAEPTLVAAAIAAGAAPDIYPEVAGAEPAPVVNKQQMPTHGEPEQSKAQAAIDAGRITNPLDPVHMTGEEIMSAREARQEAPQTRATDNLKDQYQKPGWAGKSFALFVCSVIAGGAIFTLLGLLFANEADWAAIGLLAVLAVGAELMKIDLYGDNTVSVSVALAFAGALIGGLPGAICVSAAIALAHYIQMRPALYKTGVNYSTHLLAGAVPAITIQMLGLDLSVRNVPLLMLPIAGAALAYYAIDTGIIAMAISLSKGTSVVVFWRAQFRWLVNHYLVLCAMGAFLGIAYTALGPLGVIVFTLPVVMMRYSQKQYVERTEDSMRELRRMNDELTRANREVVSASQALENLNEELFLTLAKIIDARDPFVSGHASKVSDYAFEIGKELRLPSGQLEVLRQAGFLHDIGKIGIPEQILHKPGRLTPEEYEVMKGHAALGGEFLEACTALRHLAPYVRHHHEWWDGAGYPDRLSAEQIPLLARILSVCDAAEAMASDRPYRKGMSLPEILTEIRRCSGTQFDPVVASAFIRVAERERESLVVNSAHEVLRKQAFSRKLIITNPIETAVLEKESSAAAS